MVAGGLKKAEQKTQDDRFDFSKTTWSSVVQFIIKYALFLSLIP